LREIHFCFVLGSVRLRPVRDTVRVLVCVTSVVITSFKLKLQILLVAGIKYYVRKLQLLTLSVIPPVVAAALGHSPAPKALLQYVPMGKCPFLGVLVWSTNLVGGRSRVLHL